MSDICNRERIEDKIVRINLVNLNRAAYKNINRIRLNEIKSPALHFSITTKYEEEGEVKGEQIDRLKLHEEFEKFIKDEISRDHANIAIRDEIVSYGVDLLKEVISSKNTEGLNASE